MLDGWTAGEVRVSDAVMDLILDIGIQIHFGTDSRKDFRRIRDPFADAFRRLDGFLRLPPLFPTRSNRAYARAMAAYDAEILPYIAKRRAEGGPRHDLLSSMLEAARLGRPRSPAIHRADRQRDLAVVSAGRRDGARGGR